MQEMLSEYGAAILEMAGAAAFVRIIAALMEENQMLNELFQRFVTAICG